MKETMYSIQPENEKQIVEWLKTRGGVAVWANCDLGSPNIGALAYTPAKRDDGTDVSTPHWKYDRKPVEVVTDPSKFEVVTYSEFRRVKVPTGPPMYGGLHRLDKDKVYRAMDEAGEGAVWIPDYGDCKYGSPWWTAVVKKLDGTRPLNMEVA